MNTLLISYDLLSPETRNDYEVLIKYLKSFNFWAKPLLSLWLVKTDKSCDNVRDEIKLRIDSNDKVLIVDVTKRPWATHNISKEILNWMHGNL